MTVRRESSNPAARTGKPRTVTATASVLAAAGAYFATEQGSGLLMQVIVFAIVAAAGALVPSLRLTDPTTRRELSTDSSISSVILSLAAALGGAIAAGELPLPDSARAMIVALLAALTGTHVPSVVGSAMTGLRRPVRGSRTAGEDRLG